MKTVLNTCNRGVYLNSTDYLLYRGKFSYGAKFVVSLMLVTYACPV